MYQCSQHDWLMCFLFWMLLGSLEVDAAQQLAHRFVFSIVIIASLEFNFLTSGTTKFHFIRTVPSFRGKGVMTSKKKKKKHLGTYNRNYLLGQNKLRRKREHLSFLSFLFRSIMSKSFRCAHSVCCSTVQQKGWLRNTVHVWAHHAVRVIVEKFITDNLLKTEFKGYRASLYL